MIWQTHLPILKIRSRYLQVLNFLLTIFPDWGCAWSYSKIKKNVADVFQRFPSNANANLNENFYFFIFYCIFLFIYIFFFYIYRLPPFQLSPQTIYVWDWSFYFQFSKGGNASRPIKISPTFWQRYKISILQRRCLFACHLKRYHTKGK